jgi:ABC-type branched-subunit amino acid transport system ATPase component/ABC-type branched-subunit amino acid transport system permease subunit
VGFTLFIVPALAAALVGNLSQVGIAVGAGLVIGMVQSEAVNRAADLSWLPDAGTEDLVPLVVILIFLVIRGQGLPSRGAIVQQTLGLAPRPHSLLLGGAGIAVLGVLGLVTTSGSTRSAVITTIILAVIALSQVVVTGFSGQISLAQLTLAGVGAFALTRIQHQLHVPFPFAPLFAAVVAMVLAVVVGLPALRIRGLPVAITTLALAVVLEHVWFNNAQFNGGFTGAPIKDPTLFGLNLGPGQGATLGRIQFGLLCLVVLLLVAGAVAYLRRSRLGAAMLAVRANERSAAAAGISVSRIKIIAFAIGGFLAGLGGAMLGYQQTLAASSSYTAIGGVVLFATAYLAGITSVSGGIVAGIIASGGIVYTLVDKGLPLGVYILLLGLPVLAILAEVRAKLVPPAAALLLLGVIAGFVLHSGDIALGTYYASISGLFLVLTVILNPEGIVGPVHEQLDGVRGRLRKGRRADVDGDTSRDGARPSSIAPAQGSERPTPAGATAAPARIHDVDGAPVLTVDNVGVRYGPVVANEGVTFTVNSGEIVGLIGPNGAGKTTLIDALTGFATSTGTVTMGGKDLSALKPFQRSRGGLGRTFQGIELYEDLSVRENVEVGTTAARFTTGAAPTASDIDRYFEILHLQDVADQPVRLLSVGQRQLVSVARAMAGRPQVVMLDEPAAGLDTTESRWLGDRLRAIRDAGITIVMVDHDMGLVLDVCDRIVVLDLGKVIAIGTPAEIQNNPEVTRAYLGTTHAHVEAAT